MLPLIKLPIGALSVDRTGDMRDYVLEDGRRRLIYSYRGPNGPTNIKATLPHNAKVADIIKAKAVLIERAEQRSLKGEAPLFENIVDLVLAENGGAGMPWVYERVRRELAGPVDVKFNDRYNRYIEVLVGEKKSVNTISHHKSVVRGILNYAWRKHKIETMPVRDFGVKLRYRDRVLSHDERQRLENEMQRVKTYLYWSVRMAEERPIRGLSDLWNLKRDNLKLFGEGSPYIEYKAKKTGLQTCVPLIDLPDILDYLKHGIPADSPYLFPRFIGKIDSVFDFAGMQKCSWEKIVSPKNHFNTLLDNSKIEDFNFHDFKRMATTRMLDKEGYTAEELIDLGFYGSRRMIDLCYKKRSAIVVLKRLKCSASVAPEIVDSRKRAVNE